SAHAAQAERIRTGQDGIKAHWQAGLTDARRPLDRRPCEGKVDPMVGVAVYDVACLLLRHGCVVFLPATEMGLLPRCSEPATRLVGVPSPSRRCPMIRK